MRRGALLRASSAASGTSHNHERPPAAAAPPPSPPPSAGRCMRRVAHRAAPACGAPLHAARAPGTSRPRASCCCSYYNWPAGPPPPRCTPPRHAHILPACRHLHSRPPAVCPPSPTVARSATWRMSSTALARWPTSGWPRSECGAVLAGERGGRPAHGTGAQDKLNGALHSNQPRVRNGPHPCHNPPTRPSQAAWVCVCGL